MKDIYHVFRPVTLQQLGIESILIISQPYLIATVNVIRMYNM